MTPESRELAMQHIPMTARLWGQMPTIDEDYSLGQPGAALTHHDRARALIFRASLDSRRVLANRWGLVS